MFNRMPPARVTFHLKLQFIRVPRAYLLFTQKMAGWILRGKINHKLK